MEGLKGGRACWLLLGAGGQIVAMSSGVALLDIRDCRQTPTSLLSCDDVGLRTPGRPGGVAWLHRAVRVLSKPTAGRGEK